MNSPIKFNPKIKFRVNNPSFVLAFDPEKNRLHEFNSTASEFLILIRKGLPKEKIIKGLSKKYKLNSKQKKDVSLDFDKFVNNLVNLNIAKTKKLAN